MTYLAFLLIFTLCLAGATAAFIIAIVMAVKRRWPSALIATICITLCALGSILTLGGVFTNAVLDIHSAYKSKIAADQKNLDAKSAPLKSLTPSIDFSKIDTQWFTCNGFSDWYRVPIRYPFEVHSIDTLDHGDLCINIAAGKSDDPNSQCRQLQLYYITHYAFDSHLFLCRQEDNNHKITFHLLHFDTQQDETYPTGAALLTAAQSLHFSSPLKLESIQTNYDNYWSR